MSDVAQPIEVRRARPSWRFASDRAAAFGAFALGIVFVLCLATLPWTMARIEPHGGGVAQRRFEAADLSASLLPPRWWPAGERDRTRLDQLRAEGHPLPARWLGTDRLGRDVLARCLVGGAISILIGLSAAALTVFIGTAWGMVAGAAGGRIDATMMRIVDVLFGLPSILLVVLLAVAAEGIVERLGADPPPTLRQAINIVTLLVAIGGVSWLTMARVIRGQTLSLRARPFMEACRAIGVPRRRQLLRHLLPNLVGPITVYATLAVPAAILSESFLSFLGIGIREPLPSWGNLAASGLSELNPVASRWWLLLWPCLLIAITLLSLNFVGERLRERLDPRETRR
ncbi:MAG TPA: ABC transporter permease [Phycisphaerales bacterium]|nr:ABC transporter permease [Phycisphaerales bacterium]HMP35959.1 ABC transporter permease [Phycisphaerales bacterium]